MRTAWLLPILALAACERGKPPPEPTRPDWRGAGIDGIAPLMTPGQVKAALDRRNYRQVACTGSRPAKADPFFAGEDSVCFEAPGRPMRLSLNFFDLREGRRLAVANFNESYRSDQTGAERVAHGRTLARRLEARLGRPVTVTRDPSFAIAYWTVPGGSRSLPDVLSTTIGAEFGATATMTSFWAYGQKRQGK